MATPVLNNGLFLRDTSYKASSHVDSYHLANMLGTAEPMDMGPIDHVGNDAKGRDAIVSNGFVLVVQNTIQVDNARGEYKWQTPVCSRPTIYRISDIEAGGESTLGAGWNYHSKLCLSKRAFGHGDIITYDKYNGA